VTHQQWHNLFYGEGDHGILCGDGDIFTELGESTKLLHLIVVTQHCHNGLQQRTGKGSSEARKGLQGRLLTQSNAVLFSSHRGAGNRAHLDPGAATARWVCILKPSAKASQEALDGAASGMGRWQTESKCSWHRTNAQAGSKVLWLEIGRVACLCGLWP
jgi:hypothetical protein